MSDGQTPQDSDVYQCSSINQDNLERAVKVLRRMQNVVGKVIAESAVVGPEEALVLRGDALRAIDKLIDTLEFV